MLRTLTLAMFVAVAARPLAGQVPSPTLAALAIREYVAQRHTVTNTPVSLIVCVDTTTLALDPRMITPSGYPQPNISGARIIPPCELSDPWPANVMHWPAVRIHAMEFFADSIVFIAASAHGPEHFVEERGVLDRAGDRITPRYLWIGPRQSIPLRP